MLTSTSFRHQILRRTSAALVWLLGVCIWPLLANGQTSTLLTVRKLYVEPFDADQAEQLRSSLIKRLQKESQYRIVDTANEADALVRGSGQVWVRGYFTTNPRSPSSSRQAVYTGFLSVELVSRNSEPLWSYLATPGKFGWKSVADDLATTMVNRLLEARHTSVASPNAVAATPDLQRIELSGAGSTFSLPIYRKWFQSFRELHPQVNITYEPVGSVEGSKQLWEKKVDFAGSDIILDLEPTIEHSSSFLYIPTVLGGVVPIYHLEGVNRDLKFTPAALADIYLGKVKKWSDPEIQSSNRDIDLPDRDIVVVHRFDGSGTTYVWSDFLSKVSPLWETSIGRGAKLEWPTGIAAKGNEGVATTVHTTADSIGYVELAYAIQQQLTFGSVRNSSGEFIRASIESVLAAADDAANAGHTEALRSITQPRTADAYPIASFTWMIFPKETKDPSRKAALTELVRWVLTSGQKECSALGYAPLPIKLATQQLQIFASF